MRDPVLRVGQHAGSVKMRSNAALTPEAREILVVDLDGTLLRSDMLAESFWSVLSHDWRSIFRSVGEIRKGRASLKRHLVIAARIDPATLPYDPGVISYVKAWRDAGGRAALVTATDFDQMLAFDAETGRLIAEAGVIPGGIIAAFLPRG